MLQSLLEQLPQDDPDYIYNLGCLLYQDGKYEDACKKFMSALQVLGYVPGMNKHTHTQDSLSNMNWWVYTRFVSSFLSTVLQRGSVSLQPEELRPGPQTHRRDHRPRHQATSRYQPITADAHLYVSTLTLFNHLFFLHTKIMYLKNIRIKKIHLLSFVSWHLQSWV